jgi:hypothetical protein
MFFGPSGKQRGTRPDTVLIIGVHREEHPFGDAVAAALDPSLAEVLRIPEGLSGRRPRQDPLLHYETLHRELYHQVLTQVRGRNGLVRDLHTGLDEAGPCADVISHNPGLLARMSEEAIARFGEPEGRRRPRPVLLGGAPGHSHLHAVLPSRTVIPRDMWNDEDFEYVGLEVYRSAPGVGRPSDRDLALWLIRLGTACHRSED